MELTANPKQKIKDCRISKFIAVFLVRKNIMNENGIVFARDFEEIGYWTKMTKENCQAILDDKACQDFIISVR